MNYIVKEARAAGRQERLYRDHQTRLLEAIGLKREDFPCFDGIVQLDETVLVWTGDHANIFEPVPPRNLLDARYNRETDKFEYTFLPVREEYVGEPVVETY